MPTPPTYVSDYEATAGWTGTGNLTTASFNGSLGDVLASLLGAGSFITGDSYSTSSSPTETWTAGTKSGGSNGLEVGLQPFTAILSANRTGMTASATYTGNTTAHGFDVLQFSNSDGVGTRATQAAPGTASVSLTLTTNFDNSAIAYLFADWNAGDASTRTHRTVNGYTPSAANGQEVTYFRNTTDWTVVVAYIPDAGAAGSKTVGLTTPSTGKWLGIAVEVRGSTAGAVSFQRPSLFFPGAIRQGPFLGAQAPRYSTPGSTTLSLALGIATETDSALFASYAKPVAIVVETDSAQAINERKSLVLGIASETDSAITIAGKSKNKAVVLATETDSAITLTRNKRRAITTASESESALAITIRKARTLGIASETETAQTISRRKTRAITPSSETDSALVINKKKSVVIAVETDSAQAITRLSNNTLGAASEADAARPLGKKKPFALSSETDSARAITVRRARTLTLASEADSALALTSKKVKAFTFATETDSAIALTRKRSRAITLSAETDQALAVSKKKPITRAGETDTALSIVGRLGHTVVLASETDSARALGKKKPVTLSGETDSARPIAAARIKAILRSTENDTALTVTHARSRIIGIASDTEAALAFARSKRALLTMSVELDQAQLVTHPGGPDPNPLTFTYRERQFAVRYTEPDAIKYREEQHMTYREG